MKPKFITINKISRIAILALIIGVLSSFFNFGIISVFFSVIMPIIFVINFIIAIYGLIKKKYHYLIGVIIFFLCYNLFFQFSLNTNIKTKDSISLISYNVRSFKQPVHSDSQQNAITEIKKIVDSINPDILLLQESSYKEGLRIKGYSNVFLGYRKDVQKTLLTIYSKYPIINKGFIDFSDTYNNAIFADLKIKQDTVRIYNTHLQSFVFAPHIIADKYNDYNYLSNLNSTISKQVEQAKLVKNHASKSNSKVIICGDFNATSYSQPYRILKKELNDSYVSNGNGFGATYSLLRYPLRLDYFLSDKQIEVLSHKNFDFNLSDHEPIYIKFKIR
ncbi:endonuclease/exonuclease/phosphatase family protein [Flavobacteriales bacterium ALC-1]|nr:endonuclease/exonuclease/phosphatase family protein [Flavobacteriales bacterium ALC-1]